jgi:uncharacterized membrane protein
MRSTSFIRDAVKLGIAGAGGFVASYYFDPQAGKSRRIHIKDRMNKTARKTVNQLHLAVQDIEHRMMGSYHATRARLKERDMDDVTINNRVPAVIGHFCSHPGAIICEVKDGIVTLVGDIFRKEMEPLIAAVRTVRGVKDINNQLTPHDNAEHVPSLQGTGKHIVYNAINRQNWPPAYRAGLTVIGSMLFMRGLRHGGITGVATTLLGTAFVTRSVTNKSIRRLLGIGAGPDVISIQKAININAPVEKIYDLWCHPEKFPSFMRNVHSVERLPDGKWYWKVKGPAGVEVSWVSEITKQELNKRLIWQSVPGSVIEHMGKLFFEDHDGKSTTVHLQMCYNPPAGALGHLVATLFRSDPKKDLDEDLVRMKSMIETGKRPHDAHDKSKIA